MSSKKPDQGQNDAAAAREARLAAALRANLHRRKAQGRARKAESADNAPDDPIKKDDT
tara:strand:+ start:839 stop:1012 length:174 start_codon:yes stop_codon:yes gene_type:complete